MEFPANRFYGFRLLAVWVAVSGVAWGSVGLLIYAALHLRVYWK